MDDEFEDFSTVNSELRYIALELMKIATKKNISFKDVASEFVDNVQTLQSLIESSIAVSKKTGNEIDG